ncbi:formate dehydrogenase [Bradyrhizobium canariense]|uniref:formate dehydrogenase n=1 Tax=Bradyrhizobium canariense TaxID=255045 RepID=UPI001177C0E0|nr:formate dehydrogenase [Bradyrhizobium canariense]
MKERLKTGIGRRDIFAIAMGGAGAALMDTGGPRPVNAKPIDLKSKRKARYQASSAEVRNFYRVNAYPVK